MSNENEQQSFVVENGITIGVIVLALFIIFAVGLPRWFDGDGTKAHTAHGSITLPKKLSDGAKLDTTAQNVSAGTQQMKETEKALGTTSAFGVYQGKDGNAYIAQAVNDAGGALLPSLQGTYTKVGDSVCLSDAVLSQAAQGLVVCRHTNSELTVQVSGQDDKKAAKYADEIFKSLT